MELLGPSAAGLCVLGIGICLFFVLAACRVRIPDDPPEVDVELDQLYRRRSGDIEPETGGEAGPGDAVGVELRPVA